METAKGRYPARECADRLDCAQSLVLGLRCGCFGGKDAATPGGSTTMSRWQLEAWRSSDVKTRDCARF